MSRLAKFKAKGSDLSTEKWEVILKARRKSTYINPDYVELILKKNKEVKVNNEN